MIARHGEAAIFRRFDALNIKNLLYMQAELVHLEAELHQIEKDERSSADPSKSLHSISVYDLRDSASRGLVTQWTKYQDIQRKVQTYSMSHKVAASVAIENCTRQMVHCSNTTPSAKLPNQQLILSSSFESGWIGLRAAIFSSKVGKLPFGTQRTISSLWTLDSRIEIP